MKARTIEEVSQRMVSGEIRYDEITDATAEQLGIEDVVGHYMDDIDLPEARSNKINPEDIPYAEPVIKSRVSRVTVGPVDFIRHGDEIILWIGKGSLFGVRVKIEVFRQQILTRLAELVNDE